MFIRILYGDQNFWVDVTKKALLSFVTDNILEIPLTDHKRADIFGDPLGGVSKSVKILINDNPTLYKSYVPIRIVLPTDFNISTSITPKGWYNSNITDPVQKLKHIHTNLAFSNASIAGKYMEQLLSVRFIKPDAKVLEIGSNIGRNTLTIATILSDDTNLVTLECDPISVEILKKHRDYNNYSFHIEDSALSKRRLIQKGWDTKPSDLDLPDYKVVKTITYKELKIGRAYV